MWIYRHHYKDFDTNLSAIIRVRIVSFFMAIFRKSKLIVLNMLILIARPAKQDQANQEAMAA